MPSKINYNYGIDWIIDPPASQNYLRTTDTIMIRREDVPDGLKDALTRVISDRINGREIDFEDLDIIQNTAALLVVESEE